MEEKNMQENIFDSLNRYEKTKNNLDLNDFSKNELEDANYSESQATKVIYDIESTINELDKSFFEAQNTTKSIHIWFKDKINDLTNKLPEDLKIKFINEISRSFHAQNQDLFKSLYDENIPQELNSKIPESYDIESEIDTNIISSEIVEKDIQNNVFLGSQYLAKNLNNTFSNNKDNQFVKEFFERALHDPKDKDLKNLISISLEKNKAQNENLKEKSPIEIATIVDNALTVGKVIYKYTNGEYAKLDVFELLKNKAISTVSTLAQIAIQNFASNSVAKVGSMIGSVFGPQGTVIGGVIGKAVGVLGGLISNTKIVDFANSAKEILHPIWEKILHPIPTILNEAKTVAKTLLSKIFS